MRVLVACEESQAITKAFRNEGHEAYSCDIQECSGGFPKWHIKGDVLKVINDSWDIIIAHPPCTYISNSGVRWLYKDKTRWSKLDEACQFFNHFLKVDCPKVCIENPIPHKYAIERLCGNKKYDQIIQPYMFGHPESKATCLWLKGLPKLKETNNVKHIYKAMPKNLSQRIHYLPPGPERAKLRSKTFEGIALAMAKQWGKPNQLNLF